ncbi:hypothetical protein SAMN05660772_00311 [Pasteurella testudinis DSM 23072]|uniref:Uncharacterized protein n=1 Tax=Pasteurella testudinis DSM 23072 TaxID=1122938 RepID=A0A1W1UDD4_9PAST|nr:hypothetical protein SAMN05660772_00311 [Pasteurella testudinis DSM 23072]SUB52412.1 Uncharacterised protein [Pasteurella testudinis]
MVFVSLLTTACQNYSINRWDNKVSYPNLSVGAGTEKVIKASHTISSAQQPELSEKKIKRLQKARDWINQLNQQSKAVEQFEPVKLQNIDTVNPSAYLYIDDYNVRLGKVRVGFGQYAGYRLASLGASDKYNIYSDVKIYNCRERTSVTAITYTYTTNTDETSVSAPESTWESPRQGTAQRWLMNAICSATLVENDDSSLSVGYSVLLNRLD